MGVTVDWYNEAKTILCYTFTGKWEWEEFYIRWEWVKQAMASVDHKVSMMTDMRDSRYIPANSMLHLRAVAQRTNSNYSGMSVYVGTGTLGPSVSAVLFKLHPALRDKYQVFFVSTLEEAERLLDDWQKKQESKGDS